MIPVIKRCCTAAFVVNYEEPDNSDLVAAAGRSAYAIQVVAGRVLSSDHILLPTFAQTTQKCCVSMVGSSRR